MKRNAALVAALAVQVPAAGALARSLDPAFASGAVVLDAVGSDGDDQAYGVARQQDGKLVVGGVS